jgi:deoxyribonuclease-4
MRLGSHLSIAGGPHNALRKAAALGFETVAMFVRSHVQWNSPPLGDEAVGAFRRTRKRLGISPVVAHGSYLVNLAGDEVVRPKSINAMVEDLDRCGRLGIEYLVFHPGAHDDPDEGIARIAEGIDEVLDRCPRRRPRLLLETTAGQGRSIGHRFEQLADILSRVRRTRRVGICLDTCHVFAAGYDFVTPARARAMLDELDRVVGLGRLMAVHLNDSKRPAGSRVDRHAHIGHGEIGEKGFRSLLRDERLAEVPMILETPKELDDAGREWDERNAEAIRRLARSRPGRLKPGRS